MHHQQQKVLETLGVNEKTQGELWQDVERKVGMLQRKELLRRGQRSESGRVVDMWISQDSEADDFLSAPSTLLVIIPLL